jgi:O-acetyl-ADP-ribose deacetylase (regulator of RNase III)
LVDKNILDLRDIGTIIKSYRYENYQLLPYAKINYVVGDATDPKGKGKKIIIHVCNDEGRWGAGFVLALSKKWSKPEDTYRNPVIDLVLGCVQFVQVEDDIWVANMVAQKGIRSNIDGRPPIRYDALQEALTKVAEFAVEIGATVHAPRFGSGLAGGKWEKIEYLIDATLIQEGVPVFIYDLGDFKGK